MTTTIRQTLDSFGIDAEEHADRFRFAEMDAPAETGTPEGDFVEWMEKTKNVKAAFRLYGITAELPTPDDPEEIAAWWDWSHHDPQNPEKFKCAGCNNEHWIVEASEHSFAGSLALSETGRLDEFEGVTDSSGGIYNYELPEYPATKYTHVCGECALGFRNIRDGNRKSPIRFHNQDGIVDVFHASHVAFREDGYFKLGRTQREAIDALVQHEVPEGWFQVTLHDHDLTTHEKKNIQRWLRSWATGMKRDQDEYHFNFPSIVKCGIRRGMYLSGGALYVPDDADAVEEARSWLVRAADKGREASI